MRQPGYDEIIRVFGRIGLLSFGGPAAQIALMHRELVEKRPWLDEDTYLQALSLAMLLPGPEAMQLATYAGWRLRGVAGGLIAGALFVLPGAAVIAALMALYVSYGDLAAVQAAFVGIKAAVVVVVLMALRKVAGRALKTRAAWIIAGLSFVAIFALNLPFPLIILCAALYGYRQGAAAGAEAATAADPGPRTTAPLKTVFLGLGLWLAPLVALSLSGQKLLADIGWFFAWLAVVTFGGAYAVLAYMTQTVVETYGWISTPQMIDALGLAETTPGPLILVTQFVAMLAGHLDGGAAQAAAAGLVALWATFIPCFLWIFLTGPYLDRVAARPRLAAALSGVTAAVVGVILNLSVWFALHVWFDRVALKALGPVAMPWPEAGTMNLSALVLTAAAAGLMLGLRAGMIATLSICAALALVWHTI